MISRPTTKSSPADGSIVRDFLADAGLPCPRDYEDAFERYAALMFEPAWTPALESDSRSGPAPVFAVREPSGCRVVATYAGCEDLFPWLAQKLFDPSSGIKSSTLYALTMTTRATPSTIQIERVTPDGRWLNYLRFEKRGGWMIGTEQVNKENQ